MSRPYYPGPPVRLATVADIEPIASVLRQAFSEYEALYTPAAFAATTPTAGQLRQRWPEGPVWVALLGDQIVGTVAAVAKAQGLYLRSMAILPAARGQGLGKRLLQQVEHLARAEGHHRLFLSTTPFLRAAIQLYEQFGFQRTEAGPHALHGTPLFTLEKALHG